MDQSLAMGGIQGSRHLADDVEGLFDRQHLLLPEQLGQALAVDPLHGDEGESRWLVVVGIVDRHRRRVTEAAGGPRFEQEPGAQLILLERCSAEARFEDLEGDPTVDIGIERQIDPGHRATAEL